MKKNILALFTSLILPVTGFSQASWEFQIPANSTFTIKHFCVSADSCKNITGKTGIFKNTTKESSVYQNTFLFKTNEDEYLISNLNELNGRCKRKKNKVIINKIFTGTYQGVPVLVYTNETWYLFKEKRIYSNIPKEISVRVKCKDMWLNASVSNTEYTWLPTRIYH